MSFHRRRHHHHHQQQLISILYALLLYLCFIHARARTHTHITSSQEAFAEQQNAKKHRSLKKKHCKLLLLQPKIIHLHLHSRDELLCDSIHFSEEDK